MKKVLMLAAIFGALGFSSMAQEDKSEKKEKREQLSPEEKADKRTDKLSEIVGLDSEQEDKISAINLDHIMKMDKIKAEQKALKARAKEQREMTLKSIEAVLSPEQNEKFSQKRQEHKKKREEKRKERCCQHE